MKQKKLKVFWHPIANYLAIVDPWLGGLPLLTVLDDEYTGINPFLAYQIPILKSIGWLEIGEI